MANEKHLQIIRRGVGAWNDWREKNPELIPDLSEADLIEANLGGASLQVDDIGAIFNEADPGEADDARANLSWAILYKANLHGANLFEADLEEADLRGAILSRANLSGANLIEANLSGANITRADLSGADLEGADLSGANLSGANISRTNLSGASLNEAGLVQANITRANLSQGHLYKANLLGANPYEANLYEANLSGANLSATLLVRTDLRGASLNGSNVYGASVWDIKVNDQTKQENLVITPYGEAAITVDNIKVAQFIYLLLINKEIRDVIDTITSKGVLILGRFSEDRKAVLDALREELRKQNYLPILFDFDVPENRDITETVSLLARMARFIIADLTGPSSIPKELEAIVPSLAVPVQPLLEGLARPYAMFKDYWKYEWVLPPYRYEGLELLLSALAEKVIAPAEAKVKALEERRRAIEVELTAPRTSA
jgi:uncharacterized protein YjbI with pentapeptide repeats